MRLLLNAIGFLTIIPVGGKTPSEDFGRCAVMFPVVGALIGAIATALAMGLDYVLPHFLSAAIMTVAFIAVSGGLHMDGLADTADGFLSSRPRERILEIMKDSSTGAMGAMAIVATIVLKVAALACIGGKLFWIAAFLIPLAGRCSLLISLCMMRPVNPEGGLGSTFMKARTKFEAIFAMVFMFASGFLLAGLAGVVAVSLAVVVLAAFSILCVRKIGGATGDTIGAGCELAELAVAIALAAAPVQSLFYFPAVWL